MKHIQEEIHDAKVDKKYCCQIKDLLECQKLFLWEKFIHINLMPMLQYDVFKLECYKE
jgi:hypothetical protein